jgi:MinD-like ATPase involved in chromosome partitioning or flagellar assembly
MAITKEEQVQRGYNYAIVDEVDNILKEGSETDFGINFGAGVNIRLGESNTQFYIEMRYHYVWGKEYTLRDGSKQSSTSQYLPLVFGQPVTIAYDAVTTTATKVTIAIHNNHECSEQVAAALALAGCDSTNPNVLQGWVEADPLVSRSVQERRPAVELFPQSGFSRCVGVLAERLLKAGEVGSD